MFSVKPQHESATYINIHTSPPFETPSHLPLIPPLSVDTEPLFELSETYSKIPLAIYFTYGSVCFLLLSPYIPPLLPTRSSCVHKSVLSVCASIAADEIQTFLRGEFPGGSAIKASAWNAGDPGSIPGSGRSPGEGNGNPLQYSCLENPMEGGTWWATVHAVSKELDTTERVHFHFLPIARE